MAVTVTDAGPADAEEIIAVQRSAFAAQGELYSTCDIPPLVETPEDLRADFARVADHLGPCDVVLADIDAGVPDDRVVAAADICAALSASR